MSYAPSTKQVTNERSWNSYDKIMSRLKWPFGSGASVSFKMSRTPVKVTYWPDSEFSTERVVVQFDTSVIALYPNYDVRINLGLSMKMSSLNKINAFLDNWKFISRKGRIYAQSYFTGNCYEYKPNMVLKLNGFAEGAPYREEYRGRYLTLARAWSHVLRVHLNLDGWSEITDLREKYPDWTDIDIWDELWGDIIANSTWMHVPSEVAGLTSDPFIVTDSGHALDGAYVGMRHLYHYNCYMIDSPIDTMVAKGYVDLDYHACR